MTGAISNICHLNGSGVKVSLCTAYSAMILPYPALAFASYR